MVDRVELITAVAPTVRLNATNGTKYLKALKTALILLLAEYELENARALNSTQKSELATAIDQLFTLAELKKISKKWEPKRSVASGFTQTEIVRALQDLLFEQRDPYNRPTITLTAARNMSGAEIESMLVTINRLMPKTELKAVLKKWDKKFRPPASYTVLEFRERLSDLLRSNLEPHSE
ncbi:MAG: hypothetical protein AAF683_01680 [Pseudomonadota bacterium]